MTGQSLLDRSAKERALGRLGERLHARRVVADDNARRVFDHPGLRLSVASPEHMLAMKATQSSAAQRLDRMVVGDLAGRTHRGTVAAAG